MRIYFEIKTQFSNLGDALINSCLIKSLSQKGDLIICTDGVPKNFIEKLNIPTNVIVFDSKRLFFTDMLFKYEKNVLFMNPGGEDGELNKKQFLKKTFGLLRYIFVRSTSTKIIRLGVSYNNLGNLKTLYLKLLSKLITQHYVRDSLSLNELTLKGIKIDGIIPDLAFLLKAEYQTYIPNRYALVSLREFKKTNYDDVVSGLKTLMKGSTWNWSFQVESDATYIKKLISFSEEVEPTNLTFSVNQTRNHYSKFEYVITNRLHVLLLAASVGCKVVALLEKGENIKIEGILKDLGLDNLICYIDDIKEKKLSHYDKNHELLKDSFIKMNNKVETNINDIFKRLSK